ncbi:MAG: hypothetical protein IPO21_04965 [Bacteroidales bacterium]|nr:hypothetical protein [Bacteroidales bacterium]
MLDKIARSSKFLKRKSKLTPLVFLNIMFYAVENEFKSLSRIVRNAHMAHSLKIREQSIDERFSPSSVAFTKELIKETLSSQVFSDINSTEFRCSRELELRIQQPLRFMNP